MAHDLGLWILDLVSKIQFSAAVYPGILESSETMCVGAARGMSRLCDDDSQCSGFTFKGLGLRVSGFGCNSVQALRSRVSNRVSGFGGKI